MRIFLFFVAFLWGFMTFESARSAETKLVTVQSNRGVDQPFKFVNPSNPKAGAILFIGGDGLLNLSGSGEIRAAENNFFSRTYKTFANQGLMVALVDAPSDMGGMSGNFRSSKKHATDMVAVINYLKKQANVPIWMVGTSKGSISAASVAIKKQNMVDGVVLTSSVTSPEHKSELKKYAAKFPDGVASLNLQKIKTPVLLMAHEEDTCKVTPPKQGISEMKAKLKNAQKVEIVFLKGGKARKSDVCDGLSNHGFYGIEDEAVDKITRFILN